MPEIESVEMPRIRSRSPALKDVGLVVSVSLLLILVSSVPTLFGYLSIPDGKWFSGLPDNAHDASQYLSWMRESGSRVFIANKLTSEPNPPVFFNLHWWLPGRIAATVGITVVQAFHLFRVVAILLYTGTAYWLFGQLVPDRSRRRLAFVLASFASGGGWIWVIDKYASHRADVLYPTDVYTGVGNTFQVAMVAPNHALALALELAVFGMAWRGHKDKSWPAMLGAATLALLLGLGHVYDLVTVWAVLGVFGLLITLRDGFSWGVFARLSSVVVVSAPAPLYFGWLASSANYTWQRALIQYDNLGVYTPNPPHLLVLLGLPLAASLVGFVMGLRPLRLETDRDLFIKGWFTANLLVIYLPVQFQIMLLTGAQAVMALIAADLIHGRLMPGSRKLLVERLGTSSKGAETVARLLPVAFLVLVLPTNAYLLGWRILDLSRAQYPYYLDVGDVQAMKWLETNTDGDSVILSSLPIGHYVAGFTGDRAFLANGVMTLDFLKKRDLVARFFDRGTDDAWRSEFLRDFRVDFVMSGPAERSLGDYDPRGSPLFTQVFRSADTGLFRVN